MRRQGHNPWSRRGVAIVVVVVLLALINLAVLSAVESSGDEAQAAVLRVESARASHAAESGLMVVATLRARGLALPIEGTSVDLGWGQVRYLWIPAGGVAGEARFEGASGLSKRDLRQALASP